MPTATKQRHPRIVDAPAPEPAPATRKLAIIGFAPSRTEAPLGDPDWEVWVLNNCYTFLDTAQADRWFDLHPEWIYTSDIRRGPDHVRRLAEFPGRVYLWDRTPLVPNAEAFPIDRVVAACGPYMTSSISWMLGLAIAEGYREIGIWGVDMATKSEYQDQKPGCEYLIGYARGLGLTVHIPASCQLLRGKVYGALHLRTDGDHVTFDQFKTRLQALQEQRDEWGAKLKERQNYLSMLEGAKREIEHNRQLGLVPSVPAIDRMAAIEKSQADVQQDIARLSHAVAGIDGAIMESRHWVTITPEGPDQDVLAAAPRD